MTGETKNRWSVLLGLLLAATLTLSGCGSSGETDSPPGNQAGGGDSAEKDSGTSENDVGGGGDDTSTEQGQGQANTARQFPRERLPRRADPTG